ncbi:hypothetical protein [Dyadobacter sp. CY356]|uniref:hypothetical protein n=1 Tax=Dyadobacter sp. CY356 TaxID=2906442 RepID=UPI001F1EE296|nr:hypothetical protein [Dyadobacter sp. CY356]MCF0055409.1 hypothetical protein [Dyadobacter sp. CY356]
MTIDFTNITEDVIPMTEFRLRHRFTSENYEKLPNFHLKQLKPLGKKAAHFLWDYTLRTNLHGNKPFKKDFFRTIERARISEGSEKEIKLWLFQRGVPFEKPVYLSWQPAEAMIVPWKLLIRYFDHFHNCTCGDLTVMDQNLSWALLFHHQDEIFFGSNSEVKIIQMNQEFLIA